MADMDLLRIGLSSGGKWERTGEEPIGYVFRAATGDNPITGYLGQWYSEGNMFEGVKVDLNKIVFAKFNSAVHGVSLSAKAPLGINHHHKFYDSSCFLFNGSLGTYSVRKENFGDESTAHLEPVKIGESMPLVILSILAEKEEKVFETARKLKLPLEAVVDV